LISLNDIILID